MNLHLFVDLRDLDAERQRPLVVLLGVELATQDHLPIVVANCGSKIVQVVR